MRRRRSLRAWEAALLIFAGFFLMLFMTHSSPLYPTNAWVDSNCFLTVGRGMRAGRVPYRDMMEQKGPLLYFLHYLATFVSDDSFLGVYIIEALSFSAFLILAYNTARLFAGRRVLPIVIALCGVMLTGYAFSTGDLAEEFCLVPIMGSIYDGIAYFMDENRRMSAGTLLKNGFFAGCVLWIKYTTLGVHFAFMAVIAIECVIRTRRVGRAIGMCLWFLLGMAISTAPWLVYFGVHGAIGDWIDTYFVRNITQYASGRGLIPNMLSGFKKDILRNTWTLVPVCGGVAAGIGMTWRRNRVAALLICAMAASGLFFSYAGGRGGGYTFFAFTAFVPFACALLARCTERVSPRAAGALVTAACVTVGAFGFFESRGKTSSVGARYDDTVQRMFAREINKTENATLLNVGFLDGGFYLAADVVPTEKWFCTLNVNPEECYAAQSGAISDGRVDYVVTRDRTLEDMRIDDSKYDMISNVGEFCLYRNKALTPGEAQGIYGLHAPDRSIKNTVSCA